MGKGNIGRPVKNPPLIPGIYNYCDRWCERCTFTSRCATFAMSEENFPNPEDRDIRNEQFWKRLHDVLHGTLEMVKEAAQKEGIDLDSLAVEAFAEEERKVEEAARNHECARSAKAYSETVGQWFDSSRGLFEEKGDELAQKVRMALPGAKPLDEVRDLEDAVEVIRWYQHQIYVKLMRALEGKIQGVPEILEDMPKDSDGSAKVALIAMDRSMAAWGRMLSHFPDQEDEILSILVHLERLRRATEETFPEARAFVRAGFDDAGTRGQGEQSGSHGA